jgi:cation diffusion facilitator CzcD-associated flavoprotein CzcO
MDGVVGSALPPNSFIRYVQVSSWDSIFGPMVEQISSACTLVATSSAPFDAALHRYVARQTLDGEIYQSRFVIAATGCLSSAKAPDIKGLDRFEGRTLFTGRWPKDGADLTGLRVDVIGTGSSAIQAIPEIAKAAGHVTVFQRTANYSVPARNAPLTPERIAEWNGKRHGRARLGYRLLDEENYRD